MYAGRKVEEAPVADIFARPMHPYTRGLLGAVPKLGSSLVDGERGKLAEIPGLVPSLRKRIAGCAFAGRCADGDAISAGRSRRRSRKRRPAISRRLPLTPAGRVAA